MLSRRLYRDLGSVVLKTWMSLVIEVDEETQATLANAEKIFILESMEELVRVLVINQHRVDLPILGLGDGRELHKVAIRAHVPMIGLVVERANGSHFRYRGP